MIMNKNADAETEKLWSKAVKNESMLRINIFTTTIETKNADEEIRTG